MGQREIISIPTGAGSTSSADGTAASDANAGLQVTLTRPQGGATGARRPLLLINRGVASGEGDLDFLESLANAVADAGMIAAVLEPRTTRLILDDFNAFSFADEVADLLTAIRQMQQLADVDASRVDLLGWSLGAPATVEAARQSSSINRVCLVNPATASFISMRLAKATAAVSNGGRESVPLAWIVSIADAKAAGATVGAAPLSMLILHAAADRFIPPSVSLDWRASQSQSRAATERVLIARADHAFTDAAARQTCVERIVAFFAAAPSPKSTRATVGAGT